MNELVSGTVLVVYAGLSFLLLAMDRHRKQVWPYSPFSAWQVRLVRLVGWGCLALSLSACVVSLNPGEGLPLWFGTLSLAGLILVLQTAYVPSCVVPFAVLSLSLGLYGLL